MSDMSHSLLILRFLIGLVWLIVWVVEAVALNQIPDSILVVDPLLQIRFLHRDSDSVVCLELVWLDQTNPVLVVIQFLNVILNFSPLLGSLIEQPFSVGLSLLDFLD